MITVENLHVYYGHIHAVKGISFEARRGEITALIGPNGAGKSTTLKTICGLLHPREGKIELNGTPIQRLDAERVVRLGVGIVPVGRRVFPVLSVDENLEMGAYHRSDQAGVAGDKARMYEYFPALKERQHQFAGALSGGEQQMLAIARALMSKPQLLLMDEPSLGLAPILVKRVLEIIVELNRQGLTILLSEQNARGALKVAHQGIVMETGKILFADSAAALRSNAACTSGWRDAAWAATRPMPCSSRISAWNFCPTCSCCWVRPTSWSRSPTPPASANSTNAASLCCCWSCSRSCC